MTTGSDPGVVFRVWHETRFSYDDPVTHGYSEARLLPRPTPNQRVHSAQLLVNPPPDDRTERVDFFGNRVVHLGLARPHDGLVVTAVSEVEVRPIPGVPLAGAAPWEEARLVAAREAGPGVRGGPAVPGVRGGPAIPGVRGGPAIEAGQFLLESPLVEVTGAVADYARPLFPPGRPLVDAVTELTERIHDDFEYRPGATTLLTPISDVLARRRGVCQDFAHLEIACLRAHGLAARYVSGYLETPTPDGQAAPVGAHASHAWCAVLLSDGSWLDLDPTNRLVAPPAHVTLAWGRDYSDVAPLKGVVFTEAAHRLSVSVDVRRVETY